MHPFINKIYLPVDYTDSDSSNTLMTKVFIDFRNLADRNNLWNPDRRLQASRLYAEKRS